MTVDGIIYVAWDNRVYKTEKAHQTDSQLPYLFSSGDDDMLTLTSALKA